MIFDIGIKFLIGGLIIFFIVFANICYDWTEPSYTKKERLIISLMTSFFHSYKFFLKGVVILFLLDLAMKYLLIFFKTVNIGF